MKTSQFKMINQTVQPLILATLTMLAIAPITTARAGDDSRQPPLPSPPCDFVQVPEGNKVSFHVYAVGVQIYRWNGSAWVFVAPAAVLYANADHDGEVGTHYAGPTWESNSGSKVVGSRLAGCTSDATAIPWLLLRAVTSDGPGIFDRVTFIQRVNTVGGLAPSAAGSTVGEEQQVPYTAEYFFYRASDQ